MSTVSTDRLPSFSPVARDTIQARVFDELRRKLLLGEFLPGQVLKLNDLANAFGTSAQPVRESIRQLAAERAIDVIANRSARVPLLDADELEDMRRTRLALEGLAAELAAERATDEGIDRLEAIVAQAMDADSNKDVSSSVLLNLDFHATLYKMSGSTVIPPIVEGLWLRIGPLIRTAARDFDATKGRGVELHVVAIEALRRRDPGGTRAAIEADINRFFSLVKTNMSPKAPA